jgi:hypothetical protein
MIDLLFVALMQAAAGDPAPTPAATAPVEQTQTAAGETPAAAAQPPQTRCHMAPVTGSRVRRVRVCETAAEHDTAATETRDDWKRMIYRGEGPNPEGH